MVNYSIKNKVSLLDEAPDMPPEQKAKYVGITLEKAYCLEQLINEFFDITRFNLQKGD
jgi:two-component system sensor histidine kinase VanS